MRFPKIRIRQKLQAALFVALLALSQSIPNRAIAAIATDSTSNASGSDNTSITSLSWSHTVSGSDKCLIAIIAMTDTTDADRDVTSATFNGDAMTEIRRQNNDSANRTVEMWGIINPDTATANIVFNLAGTVSQTSAGAVSLTGCDQTAPFEATNGATADNDSTPSISVTVATDNAWLVGGLVRTTEVDTPLADSPGVEIFRYQTSASMTGAGQYKGPVSSGSQSVSWTSAGFNVDDYDMVIVSVKPAAGGAAPRRVFVTE